jgi:segregation and condensation protein B
MGKNDDQLVESVLFSASQPVSIREIQDATNLSKKQVMEALARLTQLYNVERKNQTSIEVIKAGDKYTMQVKHKFSDQSMMASKPEIQSHLLKTLSLIAFHQPIKQSNLRRMIGPRIYDHVDELVNMKLVHSKPHGATEMLTTTRLFPEYFGIDSTKPEEIRDFLSKKVVGSLQKE